jgi:hypothetical protein
MDILDETDEDDEMEDEVEGWGEREFVSDLSGEDADFSDSEDVSPCEVFARQSTAHDYYSSSARTTTH